MKQPVHRLLHPPQASLRLGLAQVNPTVGDLEANVRKILEYTARAQDAGVELLAFTELAVTGYPPEDLLLKPGFLRSNLAAIEEVARGTSDLVSVVGFVDVGDDIYNAAAVIAGGKVRHVYRKRFLPNYGVFDEDRYFRRGTESAVYRLNGCVFGVTICEDIWYPYGPAQEMAILGGAQLIVNINGSPFHAGKWRFREKMIATRASDYGCLVAYVNQVGGQDELVFDGHSVVCDPRGELLARGASFEEELLVLDLDIGAALHARLPDPRFRSQQEALAESGARVSLVDLPATAALPAEGRPALPARAVAPAPGELEEVYRALVTGTRDYVEKNRFSGVVIGLSGGIDSALTACVAVDALGKDRVHLVSMPSSFSSKATQSDAASVARALSASFREIPIEALRTAYEDALKPAFAGHERDVTEENLQARARGNLLMALSNKFGWLVLTTGNKSEIACGYTTLYGDMAGGFAVIKDVPKTLVFELARCRNSLSPVIPPSVIDRPPSAELRPDQKDVDTLPPYEVLDPILDAYVEHDMSLDEIVARGVDRNLARRVILMVDRAEYKRRQAAPGIKITPKAFGKDRRLPITNAFHDLGEKR